MKDKRFSIAGLAVLSVVALFCLIFFYAATQGDYGIFRRAQINDETEALRGEKAALQTELAALRNLTMRLSDQYLDLDLLDERARSVLGYLRADEISIR